MALAEDLANVTAPTCRAHPSSSRVRDLTPLLVSTGTSHTQHTYMHVRKTLKHEIKFKNSEEGISLLI